MSQLFRANTIRGLKGSVDRKENVIHGVAVASVGEAKGHGVLLDQKTLEQIEAHGNQARFGLKSRFGHPNMSSTALGTFLGRVKNFRREGDIVRGDLHLSDSAFSSPNGDLGSYVLQLAEEDPDSFGTSIVFDGELEDQLDEEGKQKKDENGKPLKPFVRIKRLWADDVVDDPAANDGLFERGLFEGTGVQLSSEVTNALSKFLDNPEAVERVISFLERFQWNQSSQKEAKMEIKELTMEMLKAERPDLVNALLNEGKASGVKEGRQFGAEEERARVLKVFDEAKEFQFQVHGAVVEAVKAGTSADETVTKFKDAKMSELRTETPATPGPSVDEELPTERNTEEGWREAYSKDKNLQDEFDSVETYVAFKKAESEDRVKIFSK